MRCWQAIGRGSKMFSEELFSSWLFLFDKTLILLHVGSDVGLKLGALGECAYSVSEGYIYVCFNKI